MNSISLIHESVTALSSLVVTRHDSHSRLCCRVAAYAKILIGAICLASSAAASYKAKCQGKNWHCFFFALGSLPSSYLIYLGFKHNSLLDFELNTRKFDMLLDKLDEENGRLEEAVENLKKKNKVLAKINQN